MPDDAVHLKRDAKIANLRQQKNGLLEKLKAVESEVRVMKKAEKILGKTVRDQKTEIGRLKMECSTHLAAIRGLELQRKEMAARIDLLEKALNRARTHGVLSRMFSALDAAALGRWIDFGSHGDLPALISPYSRAALEAKEDE